MADPSTDVLCGLGTWRPKFLQRLASKKVYMFIYGTLGIIQGMFFTYLSATLSTLEKQFGIKSKESAYLMSGNELSQILFLFAMPLMVKVKRRPFWTSVGLVVSGIGCLLMAVPYWAHTSTDPVTNFEAAKSRTNLTGLSAGMCASSFHPNSLEKSCDDSGHRRVDWFGLTFVFLGIVLTGVGNSVFYSFGIAYLDDNSSHKNSPLMLGITYTFRLLGPTLGFLLGSYCLKTYVQPDINPGFEEGDPRWIGAWWLGFPIIGVLILVFSFPLALFPQRLPKQNTDANKAEEVAKLNEDSSNNNDDAVNVFKQTSEEFWEAFKRLLTNKLFMYNFFSSLFYVFAFMGFGTFMPKYVEYQFRQKGSASSTFAGGVGTVSKAIGLLVSGIFISRYRPSARFLSGWNVLLGFAYFGSLVSFSMLGCPTSTVYGNFTTEGDIDIWSGCNSQCACPAARAQPICSKDGMTNFYSPCIAGCTSFEEFWPKLTDPSIPPAKKPKKMFKDCSCVLDAWKSTPNRTITNEWILNDFLKDWDFPTDDVIERVKELQKGKPIQDAVEGWCPVEGCDKVYNSFLIAMFILMVLGSTGRIGNVLVALRCIDVRDKSLSMAFNIVFISLFATLPAPMAYGALIDSTCILWQKECGESTNCLLYDTDSLRVSLMLTTGFIMFAGVLFDVGVWYYAKSLVIFGPEETSETTSTDDAQNVDENVKKFDQYASNLSLAKDTMYKNGGLLQQK